jgi:prepilin-type N-terminal cleavage/methylation domain-containing protein
VKTSVYRTCAVARQRGFTMIELLIVVALIAMASGLVTFALRD